MTTTSKWGTFKWGQRLWGQQDTTVQYGQADAWDDTVLLIKSGGPNTDLSQFATDLTSQAEANSTRAAIDGAGTGREILWRGSLDTATTGTLIEADRGGSDRWSIVWDGADFDAVVDGAVAASITTAIVDGTADDVSVMFTSRPNPDTTGAANACRGLLLIYNHTDSTEERIEFAHAASTFDGTETLQYLLDQGSSITTVRLGRAWHDPVEFYEEFVTSRSVVSSQEESRAEPFLHRQADAKGAEGEFFGQAHVARAAYMTRESDLRMFSPVWNETFHTPTERLASIASPWQRLAPDSSAYYMHLDLARWVSVPPNCDRLRVRVHARTFAADASTPEVGIRLYCMDSLPANPYTFGSQNVSYDFAEGILSADHTSTTGEYVDLGVVDVVRSQSGLPGWDGSVVLVLAVASEPNGTRDTNDRLEINAIHVTPIKRSVTGSGPAGGLVIP